MLPFTIDTLKAYVADGRVTERKHPTLPLYIYNYSPEVQYRRAWDEVTMTCRGLILNSVGSVIARPWKKFFNLGEVNLPIQFDDPVEVMDKMDGSLGILYPFADPHCMHDTTWAIATRGSFDSFQARHATEVLNRSYRQDFPNFENYAYDYTFLFEIIYPENRIVCDYGDMDDLVLLGAVEIATGYYISPTVAQAMLGWNGPVVEVMPYKTISEAVLGRAGKEGYVIRSHNFMVKVKEPDYIELHKLVTNASPKTVWAELAKGKSKSEIISAFPDEFHDYIGSMIDPLLEQFDARLSEIFYTFERARERVNGGKGGLRKDYAMEFNRWDDRKYFFALLDNRPIRDLLWSELKPSGDVRDKVAV